MRRLSGWDGEFKWVVCEGMVKSSGSKRHVKCDGIMMTCMYPPPHMSCMHPPPHNHDVKCDGIMMRQ